MALDYLPTRRLVGNQIFTLAGMLAHNFARELQMIAKPPTQKTLPKRPARWQFVSLSTLRQHLLHKAGSLSRPQGTCARVPTDWPNSLDIHPLGSDPHPALSLAGKAVGGALAGSRPSSIGLSMVCLEGREGYVLDVDGMDARGGTPLLGIKPYVPRFEAIPEATIGWLEGHA